SPPPSANAGRSETVTLTAEMTTYRSTEWGVTFEVRMRGTGAAVGGRVDVGVRRAINESRFAGEIEADDAQSASDWIEVEYARLSGDPEGR
ncbi:MAG: hypothetical protein ACODAE_04390, partial [Gemmatimonadota bacterium]